MRRSSSRWSIFGSLLFFVSVALTVTATLLIYARVYERSGGDMPVVATVMFLVVLFLSVLWSIADLVRRRIMVDRPVEKILSATEKIAAGDFSVRLEQRHGYPEFDEYDAIMENLNTMAEALSRSEVLKTDFITGVSHELKTPLAVIQNYALLLKTEEDAEKRKAYADTLSKAAANLSVLVTNILQLSKLENEKILPERECLRLDELLADAVFQLEDKIEGKKIELVCDLDEMEVYSVKGYLEIIFNNLISNAVKFTDEGGRVEVTLKKEEKSVAVRVADTGCGISKETGARIFDKFYQEDTSHVREGNGLGLALVKKVVDLLGASLTVESELGRGSIFTVVLKYVEKTV